MDGVEFAVGPVTGKKRILIPGRELGSIAKTNSSRGTGADVDHGPEGVSAVVGEFAGTGAPAVVSTVDDMVDSGGTIPGGIQIPFHIGVVSEHLSLAVQGRVVLVAEAGGDHVPGFALGIDSCHVAQWGFGATHKVLQGG